jgi:hypothetical protein
MRSIAIDVLSLKERRANERATLVFGLGRLLSTTIGVFVQVHWHFAGRKRFEVCFDGLRSTLDLSETRLTVTDSIFPLAGHYPGKILEVGLRKAQSPYLLP